MPRNENIRDKELEKVDKYQSLKIELEQMGKVKIKPIPVVVGAIGAIADRLPGWLVELQKSALLEKGASLPACSQTLWLWSSPESANNTTHGWVRENFIFLLL